MIDPYRMVVVNIIASLIVLVGTLFYRFAYPKKKINWFILLLIITTLPCLSLFRPGAYESGDFTIHIYRSMEFFKSLMEGHIMPSWAGELNAAYGYPLFIFNYTLPYYAISLIHLAGFTFISSMKIFLFLNIIFSAVFAYMFGKNKFKNDLTAFTVGIFYVFFPYHLVALHFKVTIGEIITYTLIPLYFLFLNKYIQGRRNNFIVVSAIILALITLSHIFIAIFLIPITFFYLFRMLSKRTTAIFSIVSIGSLTALISAYQWLPTLIYKSYLFTTYAKINIEGVISPTLIELLYSPWRLGLLFQGPQGQISYLIGYAQIFAIALIIYLLIKKRVPVNHFKEVCFWIVALFIVVFLILPESRAIWSYAPFLYAAGPQRLLIIVGFIVTLLAGYVSIFLKNKKYIYLLIVFCILTTFLNWGQRRVIPQINDDYLKSNLPYSTFRIDGHFYAATKYQDPKKLWMNKTPKSPIEPLSKTLKFKSISRNTTSHVYEITAVQDTKIIENTLYFPGWIARARGKNLKIYPGNRGIININLPKGNYTLKVEYIDIFSFKIAKLISIISLLMSILYIAVKSQMLRKFPKF